MPIIASDVTPPAIVAPAPNAVAADKVVLNPPPGKGPVVIRNDGGGFVVQYAAAVERLASSGRRVEVRGSCRSACTMVLEIPNVCVDRNAEFKWHQAYDKYTGVRDYATTQWMLNRLPTKIRARIEGQVTRSYSEKTTLRYDDIRALGVADCDSAPTVTAKFHTPRKTTVAESVKTPFDSLLAPFLYSFRVKNQKGSGK